MMDDVITREDALNAINRIWDKCEEIEAHFPEGDPDKTGYKMIADYLTVLKYLSAQPEIKMDEDMISRQAALDAVEESRRENHHKNGKEACCHEYEHRHFLKILHELPSAQPERKTGRWIYEERKRLVNETDDGPVYRTEKWWLCSECGYAKGYQISKPSSNYCENCGAKMLKEGENIDS